MSFVDELQARSICGLYEDVFLCIVVIYFALAIVNAKKHARTKT